MRSGIAVLCVLVALLAGVAVGAAFQRRQDRREGSVGVALHEIGTAFLCEGVLSTTELHGIEAGRSLLTERMVSALGKAANEIDGAASHRIETPELAEGVRRIRQYAVEKNLTATVADCDRLLPHLGGGLETK